MKPWDQYKAKEAYPDRIAVVREYIKERMPALDDTPLTKEQREKAENELKEEAKRYYQERRKNYTDAVAAATREFWEDARNDLGYDAFLDVEGMQLLESKAWDDGHSYGYSEIFSHLKDLVSLMRKIQPHFKR